MPMHAHARRLRATCARTIRMHALKANACESLYTFLRHQRGVWVNALRLHACNPCACYVCVGSACCMWVCDA
eukprot:6195097-Pleurochrysis_carterae.AAC.2